MGDNSTNFGGLWRQFLDKIYLQRLLFSGGGGLVTKSCRTLYDPMDSSLPGFSVHGIFSRQEYWSGWPFPSPGDLPNPQIEPTSPALTGGSFTTVPPGKHVQDIT